MAPGQPALKTNELLDRIRALGASPNPSELDIAQIRRDAASLRKADMAGACMILGLLSGILQDENGMKDNFSRAIAQRPEEPVIRRNFGAALLRMGFFREAFESIQQAAFLEPANLGYLDAAIHASAATGRFTNARDLLQKWHKLNPKDSHDFEKTISQGAAYFEECGITEHHLDEIVNLLGGVLRECKASVIAIYTYFLSDEESHWMSWHFHVLDLVERVAEFNDRLADRLAMPDLQDNPARRVTFLCGPSTTR